MASEADVDRLVIETFFHNKDRGVTVEIGAAKPDFLSIGAGFRSIGWRVISVEPNPVFAKLHRNLGHEIVEVAAADIDEDNVDFTVVTGTGGLIYDGEEISHESFSSLGIRGEYRRMLDNMSDKFGLETIKVRKRRLDTILSERPEVEFIDVIAVDVEGWEIECLKGFSFGRLAPKVVIVENLFNSDDYRRFMKSKGYTLWRNLAPNDVYVKAEKAK